MNFFYPFSSKFLKSSLALLGCAAVLAACGGGGGGDSGNPVILKSNVTGMNNSGPLVLRNEGDGDVLTISENGIHSFAKPLHPNDSYNVTVVTAPTGQTCSVNNGEGVIVAGAPAPVVNVSCSVQSYTVGGTITGLQPDKQVLLLNNGADLSTFTGPSDGSAVNYSFKKPVAVGSSYTVTTALNPHQQVCTVAKAGSYTGTSTDGQNVTNVDFMCDAVSNAHTVGGTVTGLVAGDQIVLQNNGSDDKTIASNGQFSFDIQVANKSSYDVRILTLSADLICTIQNGIGEGQAVQGNVNNILISCHRDHTFTISGTVQNWNGSAMILKNSKTNSYATVAPDGSFAFPPVVYDTPYEISVSTFPVLQDCTVANNNGTVLGDVTLTASCETAPVKTIYSFAGDSGAADDIAGYPVGLMQHSNGDLYGITTVRVVGALKQDRVYNTGNIFKTTRQGVTNPLYTFRGSNPNGIVTYDPSFPTGLMQGQDNDIYVTTYLGGPGPIQNPGEFPSPSTNVGEIYKLNTSSNTTESVFPFSCGTDPLTSPCTQNVAPIAELIQDANGAFYGVEYGYALRAQRAHGGVVYQLDSSGAYTPLHTFAFDKDNPNGYYPDGLHPNGKLTLVDGFLYGTTEKGGLFDKGTIFRVTVSGTDFEVIYHFDDGTFPAHPGIGGTNNQYPDGIYSDPYANPYSGLLLSKKDGNLYGLAKYGGDNNAGYFFKVTLKPGAITFEQLYSFAPVNNPFPELVQLSDGNFYGTTERGGSHAKGSIFKLTPQGALTTLHDFAGIIANGDGNTPSTRLVVGNDGSLYGGTRLGGVSNLGAIYKMGRD